MTDDELDALEAKARAEMARTPHFTTRIELETEEVLALSAEVRHERAARIEAERWRDEVRGELAAAREEIAEMRAGRA